MNANPHTIGKLVLFKFGSPAAAAWFACDPRETVAVPDWLIDLLRTDRPRDVLAAWYTERLAGSDGDELAEAA